MIEKPNENYSSPNTEAETMKLSERLTKELEHQLLEFPEKKIFGPMSDNLFALRDLSTQELQRLVNPGKVNFLGETTIGKEKIVLVQSTIEILSSHFNKR